MSSRIPLLVRVHATRGRAHLLLQQLRKSQSQHQHQHQQQQYQHQHQSQRGFRTLSSPLLGACGDYYDYDNRYDYDRGPLSKNYIPIATARTSTARTRPKSHRNHFSSSSSSGLSSLSNWVKDVIQTKSLQPSNPILTSLDTDNNTSINTTTTTTTTPHQLPEFSRMLPYHLESATKDVRRQYNVDLAELEVSLMDGVLSPLLKNSNKNSSGESNNNSNNNNINDSDSNNIHYLLQRLDEIEAPVNQLLQVGRLYSELAASPDLTSAWQAAYAQAQSMARGLPWRDSKIIYQHLIMMMTKDAASNNNNNNASSKSSSSNAPTTVPPPALLLDFEKQGVHLHAPLNTTLHSLRDAGDPQHHLTNNNNGIDDGTTASSTTRQELQEIQEELQSIRRRLQQTPNYNEQPKAVKLRLVSDLYNWIGLSQLQTQKLESTRTSVVSDSTDNDNNNTNTMGLATRQDILELAPKVADILKPHLPSAEVALNASAGAFLPTDTTKVPTDDDKAVWKAKFQVKKLLYLHGVLQGVADFYDAMFGIHVELEEMKNSDNAGWNKNVRVLHLYDKTTAVDTTNSDSDSEKDGEKMVDDSKRGKLLGTIYLDPFRDPYFRSETAKDLVTTRLFSQSKSQTPVPVAIVALKIEPTWDDVPTPLSWNDTRDVLYQIGKAVQLILSQAGHNNNGVQSSQTDTLRFMGAFMEMWIQNDGFLQRLAQLSQDKFTFEPETMKALRKDLQKQKAMEIMHSAFLGTMELSIFSDFDPRGDETLAALQGRLAEEYIPHDIPDSSDLSPLLELLQDDGDAETAYSALWSEVLAAMVYEKFQKTDLRDREEVQRLGRGVRDLFLRDNSSRLTKKDVEDLCGSQVTPESLKRVYKF